MLKAFFRDSIIYGISLIATRGMAIFSIPLYSRVLSPKDYGAYDLILTLAALANLIVVLEISQGVARYWVECSEILQKVRLASTVIWFSIIAYCIFFCLGILYSSNIAFLIFGQDNYDLEVIFGLLFIAANGIYLVLINQFRWELRSKEYSFISFSCAFLTIFFAFFLCFIYKFGLIGIIASQIIAISISCVICLFFLRNTLGFYFDFIQLLKVLRFSTPLVPSAIAVFVSFYINRFAINHYSDLNELGYFAMASRLAGMAGLLVWGVQTALTPLIYQHYRDPDTPIKIAKISKWFFSISLLSCLFLMFFSKELIMIFSTENFMKSSELICVLAPAFLISQMYIFAPGIGIAKKTLWQLVITLISALFSVLGNWILVPYYGALGASIASLISSSILLYLWIFASQRYYYVSYEWGFLFKSLLAFLLCILIESNVDILSSGFIFLFLAKILIILFFVYTQLYFQLFSRNELDLLCEKIKHRMAFKK